VTFLCFFVVFVAGVPAQSDLDALMSRVLTERDRNWAKLQQYVLEERETMKITGPIGIGLYGFDREYSWFPRDDIFVRSPRRADGVVVSDRERRLAEEEWILTERRFGRTEPRFVAYAYVLRFRFDPGRYGLVGRERLLGRDVLKIDYYPTMLFTEGRTRPDSEPGEHDRDVDAKMNQASTVTFWIDPANAQVLQYHMQNVDMDFLPGRSVVRLERLEARMQMSQPFPGVWLPSTIRIMFNGATALGDVKAQYDIRYYDYRLAEVTTRVR
jgi:hypothetical protein